MRIALNDQDQQVIRGKLEASVAWEINQRPELSELRSRLSDMMSVEHVPGLTNQYAI